MTRKDYEAIAKILRTFNTGLSGTKTIKPVAKQLAGYFAEDNKKFDTKRFLEACNN